MQTEVSSQELIIPSILDLVILPQVMATISMGQISPIRSFNFVTGRYNILGSTTKKIVGATASGYYLNLTNDYSTAFGKFNANYSNAIFEVGSGNNATALNSALAIATIG